MDLDITALARIGAANRIAEIEGEIASLVAAFPDIEQPAPPDREVRRTHINNVAQHIAHTRKIGTVDVHIAQDAAPRRQAKPHHHMSEAARKAQSRRMRARWRAFHEAGHNGQLRKVR